MNQYQLYSRATKSGGAVIKSSGSGGGSLVSSSAGGGSVISSSSGGGVETTSGFSNPGFYLYTSTRLPLVDPTFDEHIHAVEVTDELNHAHRMSIPAHQHNVTIPNHQHTVQIPNHVHDIDIPEHQHDIEHGIYKLDRMPTSVEIRVDGNLVPYSDLSADELDLVPYLAKDSDGRVFRGYHKIEILPNDLARIAAQINTKFFVQSRGEYTL